MQKVMDHDAVHRGGWLFYEELRWGVFWRGYLLALYHFFLLGFRMPAAANHVSRKSRSELSDALLVFLASLQERLLSERSLILGRKPVYQSTMTALGVRHESTNIERRCDAVREMRVAPWAADLGEVGVPPRFVYVDASCPGPEEGFNRRTFAAMVEGVCAPALEQGLIDAATWERGIGGLRAADGPEGAFGCTFFKGVGRK